MIIKLQQTGGMGISHFAYSEQVIEEFSAPCGNRQETYTVEDQAWIQLRRLSPI